MKTLTPSISIALLSLAIPLTACNSSAQPKATADRPYATVDRPYSNSSSCYDCGTITSVEQVTAKGEGSGLGMVLGAVAGAVVGHKIGGDGKSQDAATVVGAVGGGYAGNEVEKRVKGTKYFEVTVAMDYNGGTRTFDVQSTNGLTNGSRVKVVGSNLQILG